MTVKGSNNYFRHFPWDLFLLVAVWVGIGLVNLYSATYRVNLPGLPPLFRSQLIWIAIGFCLIFMVIRLDYQSLRRWSQPVYFLVLLLLVLVLVLGRSVGDQRNWLVLGGFSFQPSELAKFALIVSLATYYSTLPTDRVCKISQLYKPIFTFLLPLGLIVLERDMGGALLFVLIFLTMTFFVRLKVRYLFFALIFGLTVAVGGYQFVLKDYQKARVKTFMNPELDPKGKGYHVIQSKIAVGSGGVSGRGFLKGNINKLKYLPERHTDFIFAVFAEEWGLIGCLVLLSVICLFLVLGIDTAFQIQDPFGSFLALGITALFFWNLVINLGGILGILPLTGVPLPLLSYGGSSILTMMMSAGLLMNLRRKRFMF